MIGCFSFCVVCVFVCALRNHICACGRHVVAYMYVSTYMWRHKVDPRCVPSSLTTCYLKKTLLLSSELYSSSQSS